MDRIRKRGKGHILFPSDLNVPGDQSAVLVALHRLVKDKVLMRLGKGIYYYPKEDAELGTLLPSLEEIAEALATHDHVKIRPTGIKALNELGLSTQVPLNVVYLTTGKSKIIRIGKNSIRFKAENPRRMALKDNTLGKLILALQEVGKNQADKELRASVENLLSRFSPDEIWKEAKKASPWVRDILVNFAGKKHDQVVTGDAGAESSDH